MTTFRCSRCRLRYRAPKGVDPDEDDVFCPRCGHSRDADEWEDAWLDYANDDYVDDDDDEEDE